VDDNRDIVVENSSAHCVFSAVVLLHNRFQLWATHHVLEVSAHQTDTKFYYH